jgi:hypothetical protein
MNKIITLVATTAIAGSNLMSTASAQQGRSVPERDRPTVSQAERERPTVSQIVAYDEARIARLKADLRLFKDQDGNWGKFESALKDISKERADRFVAWTDERAKRSVATDPAAIPTLAERLRKRADAMAVHAGDLKKLADASEPLLEKLDDTQKRRASEFIEQYAAAPVPAPEIRRSSERQRNSWFW